MCIRGGVGPTADCLPDPRRSVRPLQGIARFRDGYARAPGMRLVLVVDEARRVLSYGQPSLISLVRESRSKGMSVFLISQSPEDYDTAEEDFLDQIGLTACFRANGSSPRVLEGVPWSDRRSRRVARRRGGNTVAGSEDGKPHQGMGVMPKETYACLFSRYPSFQGTRRSSRRA